MVAYKVVVDRNGRFFSATCRGWWRLQYTIGKETCTHSWLIEHGFGITAFDSKDKAFEFAAMLHGRFGFKVLSGTGDLIALPAGRISHRPTREAAIKEEICGHRRVGWPEGTIMCRSFLPQAVEEPFRLWQPN